MDAHLLTNSSRHVCRQTEGLIRQIVLILLILSCSVGLAQAEWKIVEKNSNYGGSTVYFDPTTHRTDKKSGLVKMWVLFDYKTRQRVSEAEPWYLSVRRQEQYDCKQEQMRSLGWTFFTDNMADGRVIRSHSTTEEVWTPVAPGSIAKDLWKLACGTTKP